MDIVNLLTEYIKSDNLVLKTRLVSFQKGKIKNGEIF